MSELYRGRFYLHPEDGLIHITGGQKWVYTGGSGGQRLSNHFYWTVVLTGETHNGYGGNWPEYKDGKLEVIKRYEINGVPYGPEVRTTS